MATKPSPVGTELFNDERLLNTGTEPKVHQTRSGSAEGPYGVGVKTKLQHVTGLAFGPRELGVNRFVLRVTVDGLFHANEEVRDSSNSLVYERHLEDRVVTVSHGVTHAKNPRVKRFAGIAAGNPVDRLALVLQIREAVVLVGRTFFHQQVRERSAGRCRHGERARVDLVSQGQEVCALEPRGDLGRSEEPVDHVLSA